ncbi:FMN-binding negative transcriptional regulator [Flavihumibacter profundi]|uniref:FMN-binding negative transcriptional regulator n=1 Tax=Flavihumibacter profundi TaxID=2716883 RepID=UPI001CC4AEB3|nr:FMN-binding negative transcriptional regulator [Flavihumibacter profundi]MBZ5857199.1 FMN-binding negative transcriptional regulator [Flavihumibacter profundi]
MYDVKHFKAVDEGEVLRFMYAHPFVIICGTNESGLPVATHIPILLEERAGKLILLGHVMRKQEHTRAFETHPDVLVIFSGAHSYVSASWYTDPKMASTWNYQAVHARGQLRFLDDNGLYDLLTRLTRHFEGRDDSPSLVSKMSDEYMQNTMKAIVAFEVEVTELSHIFKLSQNRNEESYHNVVAELQQGDAESRTVADIMQNRGDKLFGRG